MQVINLTPHALKVYGKPYAEFITIPPSGIVARVDTVDEPDGEIDEIPVVRTQFGAVSGLPDPKPDVVLVVSRLVLNAATDRDDLVAPGALVRDDAGRPIGCHGFSR